MRWSALRKLVHNIWDDRLEIEIFCTAYRREQGPELGCYWIKVDGRTIWSRPEDIRAELARSEANSVASDVTAFIRQYLDTPKDQLWELEDPVGLLGIFLAADRRIGKRKLSEVANRFPMPAVRAIVDKRLETPVR